MKPAAIVVAGIVCIGALVSGNSFADGVTLVSRYLDASQERSQLNQEETKSLNSVNGVRGFRDGRVISINLNAFVSNVISLTLPNGKTHIYVGSKAPSLDEQDKAFFIWKGASAPSSSRDAPGLLIIGSDGKRVTGNIVQDGVSYRISRLSDRYQVIQTVEPSGDGPGPNPPEPKIIPAPSTKSSGGTSAVEKPGDPTIRILTVFSDAAGIALGDPIGQIGIQLSLLNQSFANSGVNLNVVGAGTMKVSAAEGFSGQVEAVVAKARKNLQILFMRDAVNADVVMIITRGFFPSDGESGFATQIYADASTAFAGVKDDSLYDLTYLHEFGHLVGARHQSSGGSPSVSNDPNNYPAAYGHGWWVRQAEAGLSTVCYHTIMSSPSASGPACGQSGDEHAMRWSNPAIYYRGYPTGANVANNALLLNNYGPRMTEFRNSKLSRGPLAVISTVISTLMFP